MTDEVNLSLLTLKPGFGLVTQSNAPSFIPFNSTQVSNATLSTGTGNQKRDTDFGVTDSQRDDAYQTWLSSKCQRFSLMVIR